MITLFSLLELFFFCGDFPCPNNHYVKIKYLLYHQSSLYSLLFILSRDFVGKNSPIVIMHYKFTHISNKTSRIVSNASSAAYFQDMIKNGNCLQVKYEF